MRATRGQSGFTLLEVLVALVCLGMLMLLLRQCVSVGAAAWDTQSRLVATRQDLDVVARALRRLVEQMDPGTEMEPVRLSAGPHALSFPTELPAAASALAHRAVDATLMVNAQRLVLRWTPRRHAVRLGPQPPPVETELLRGVARLDVDYWGAGAAGWRSDWSGEGLPALVRIRLAFPAGDRRRWPEIVAAPARDRPAE